MEKEEVAEGWDCKPKLMRVGCHPSDPRPRPQLDRGGLTSRPISASLGSCP